MTPTDQPGSGLLGGAGRFWLVTCALPSVVFPLLLAAVNARLEDGIGGRC